MDNNLDPIDLTGGNRIDLRKHRNESLSYIVGSLIVIVFLYFGSCSSAEAETSFVIGGWSKHYIQRNHTKYSDINENHKAIGFTHNDWFLIGFDNSFQEYGALGGKRFKQFFIGRFSYSINAGTFYGYDREQMRIVEKGLSPYFAIVGSFKFKFSKNADIATDVSFAPTVGDFKGIAMANIRYIPRG